MYFEEFVLGKDAYGKRMARNIYAPTREECEEKLAILITEMNA